MKNISLAIDERMDKGAINMFYKKAKSNTKQLGSKRSTGKSTGQSKRSKERKKQNVSVVKKTNESTIDNNNRDNNAFSNLKFENASDQKKLDIGVYDPKKAIKTEKNIKGKVPEKDTEKKVSKIKAKSLKSKVVFDSSNQILFERGSSYKDETNLSSTKNLRDVMDSIVWLNEESDDELSTPPEFVINQLMTEKFPLTTIKSLSKKDLIRNWADIEYILNFKYQFISH